MIEHSRQMRKIASVAALAAMAALLAACGSTAPPPVVDRGADSAERRPATASSQQGAVSSAASPAVGPRGGAFYKDDGPGDNPPDLNAIADAEPRVEALHRFANNPYNVFGVDYAPLRALTPFKQRGVGSWYGRKFHGQRTSSGETYDMYGMTAAHPTLPIPSYARVTSVATGRSVVVRVNDRGPFHSGRVIDLSYTAAWKLGYANLGSTQVDVELLTPDAIVAISQQRQAAQIAAVGERNAAGRQAGAPAANAATNSQAPVQVSALPESSQPAPAALAGSLPVTAAGNGVFLQLGAFSARDNAENFRTRVYRDLTWLSDPIEIVQKDGLFRLHLGPYKDRNDAGAMSERIRTALEVKPVVVVR
jgi:rare lipoprotein A